MEQNTQLMPSTQVDDPQAKRRARVKTRRRKMVFNLTFGIVALILAIAAASFASIMSLMGFSVAFTDKGQIPMASCLISIYINAVPALICGVLSQKLGMVSGLNKVSIALGIASSAAGTVIFVTLLFATLLSKTSILL